MKTFPAEQKVFVDPSLYVEPPVRAARGTIPPPSLIGPYSCIADRAETVGD